MVPGVSIDRTKPLYGQQATDPAPESPRRATVCLNRSIVAICMTASTQINDDHACTIERSSSSSSTARLQVTSLNRTGQYTGTRVVLRLLLCVSRDDDTHHPAWQSKAHGVVRPPASTTPAGSRRPIMMCSPEPPAAELWPGRHYCRKAF